MDHNMTIDSVIYDMSSKVGKIDGTLEMFVHEQRIMNQSLQTLIANDSARIRKIENSNNVKHGIALCLGVIGGFLGKFIGHA